MYRSTPGGRGGGGRGVSGCRCRGHCQGRGSGAVCCLVLTNQRQLHSKTNISTSSTARQQVGITSSAILKCEREEYNKKSKFIAAPVASLHSNADSRTDTHAQISHARTKPIARVHMQVQTDGLNMHSTSSSQLWRASNHSMARWPGTPGSRLPQ